MTKGFNKARFNSQIRQAQRKFERDLNRELHKAERKFEAEVNREIRKYNNRAQHNRRLIERELHSLSSHTTVQNTYTISLTTMQRYYATVDATYRDRVISPEQEYILDLIDQEQANGLITANVVENNELPDENTDDIEIGDRLSSVSEELNNRWQGALWGLDRRNPDAARHFCTSIRELFTDFIEMKAPDHLVFAFNPWCKKTERGNATRREKINFMMHNKGMDESVIDYAEADIENLVSLITMLNSGTHGPSGKYNYEMLLQVKKRVEQGIIFLCEISA